MFYLIDLEKNILPGYIRSCRWFGGKSRKIKSVTINRTLTVNSGTKDIRSFHFFILKVAYSSGKAESYLLPVALVSGDTPVIEKGIIAVTGERLLIDAIYDADFRVTIFNHLLSSAEIKQAAGKLIFERGSTLAAEDAMSITESRVPDADQSNSSIIYGERFFLKIYRKLFTEINPDVEVTRFLTEEAHFKNIPAFAGTLSWKKSSGATITLGLMQQKVNAVKDAWSLTGDFLNEYLLSLKNNSDAVPETSVHQARALGECTARMHMALACKAEVVAFAPEKFNHHYTRQLVANSEDLVKRRLRMIKDSYASLDEQGKELAKFYIENYLLSNQTKLGYHNV